MWRFYAQHSPVLFVEIAPWNRGRAYDPRMRVFTSYFILQLFCFTTCLTQSADIRGIVSDSSTGEGIPFASVRIPLLKKGTSANNRGFYIITNVPPGEHVISASSIGFIPETRKVSIQSNSKLTVNFKIAPQPLEGAEVEVVEESKRELTERLSSIHILGQKEMKLVPVTLQEDVFRSIQILPGIVSTSDVSSQFYVRGGAGDQNLILLDGMRIYNPYHALGIFTVFDSDIISATEVYTGAYPPEYGGRLSSVVNLTTRSGKSTSFSGKSSVNFLSSKAEIEGPLGDQIRFIANGRKSLFNTPLNRFLARDTPLSFFDFFAKATIDAYEGQAKFSFLSFFSGDKLASNTLDEPDYRWENRSFAFTASGLLQDRFYVNSIVYGSFFNANKDVKASKTQTSSSTEVKEVTIRAEATLYTNSKDVYFFGFEFEFPDLTYNLTNNTGTRISLSSGPLYVSAWFHSYFELNPFKIDGGAHLDASSLIEGKSGYWFQPRITASVSLSQDWILKLSYGRFTQNIITVNNEDDLVSLFDAWIAVPQTLENEHSDHYVVSVEGSPFPRLSLTSSVYYKDLGSLVTYNKDKVTAQDPDYVSGSSKAYGAEFLARASSSLVDIYMSYSLGWVTITSNGANYLPRYDRRHSIKALSVFHVSTGLDFTLRWDYGSGFPFTPSVGKYNRLKFPDLFDGNFATEEGSTYLALGEKNSQRLPPYHRLDLSINYRFSLNPITANMGLHIINVYDRKNIFHFDRNTGQRINTLPFFPTATLSVEF